MNLKLFLLAYLITVGTLVTIIMLGALLYFLLVSIGFANWMLFIAALVLLLVIVPLIYDVLFKFSKTNKM